MKGHILILTANILFGISMPIFKYLLTSNVPPEAITIMRASFACMMFWLVSFFMPKEKVLLKDLVILLVCALCGVGINQWLFYNPQIQISAESETKRSIFREKDKTKRSKKESAQHSKSRNKSFVMTSVSAL